MIHLLDANVLIALAFDDHEFHDTAASWATASDRRLALTPVVEGALIRFAVRAGLAPGRSLDLLRRQRERLQITFWPDAVSYLDVDLSRAIGHKQVTDLYLAGLARTQGAKLATFDAALAALAPDVAVIPSADDAA